MTHHPDPKAFRDAMRAFVGNCSVLTVGSGDQASGLVVTSGISLSADPALILACVNRTSSSWPLFSPGGGIRLVLARRRPSGRCRALFGVRRHQRPGALRRSRVGNHDIRRASADRRPHGLRLHRRRNDRPRHPFHHHRPHPRHPYLRKLRRVDLLERPISQP